MISGILKDTTKHKKYFTACAFVMTIGILLFSNITQAVLPSVNTIISSDSNGNASNGHSQNPMISANGEYVAFESLATNLVANDTNAKRDIFLKNIRTGETKRISVSSSGAEANDESTLSVISETGRYIAYRSKATNLIDSQIQFEHHSYIYDSYLNTTEIITLKPDGTSMEAARLIAATGAPFITGLSNDGRYVALTIHHNFGFVPLDSPTHRGTQSIRVAILDRSNNSRFFADKTVDGTWEYNQSSTVPVMSCDGSLLAFYSSARNLTNMDGVPEGRQSIFLSDLRGDNIKISRLPIEVTSISPLGISCNGNYITFASNSNDLVPELPLNNDHKHHYYMYDRINDKLELLDKSTNGNIPSGSSIIGVNASIKAVISNNGVAAFSTPNGIDGSTGGSGPWYPLRAVTRDTRTGITKSIAMRPDNVTYAVGPGGAGVTVRGISQDERYAVAISPDATGLIAGDANGFNDIVLLKTGF